MTLNDSVFSTIMSFMMVILTHTSFSHFSNDKVAGAREVKSVCVSEDTSEYDRIECSTVKVQKVIPSVCYSLCFMQCFGMNVAPSALHLHCTNIAGAGAISCHLEVYNAW